MPTLTAIAQRMLTKMQIGMVIPNAVFSAVDATSVTVLYFLNTNYATNHLRDLEAVLYRPSSATAADNFRYAGNLVNTSGAITIIGANYADVDRTSETLEVWYYGIRRDIEVINAINRALESLYHWSYIPLSEAADADFASSATSSYTESDTDGGPATGFTKVTTANSVFMGPRAGRVVNTAAGGYIRQRFGVQPGEQIFTACLSALALGTSFELGLQDLTNSAAVGTALDHSEAVYQYVWRFDSVPSGCRSLEVRLRGSGASDDFNLNALWFYRTQNGLIRLPSSVDEPLKLECLAYADFSHATESGVNAAFSMNLTQIPRDAYHAGFDQSAANPNWVIFHDLSWFQHPLFIAARRPYSDDGTLSAETDVTNCPLDLIESLARVELLTAGSLRERIPDGDFLLAKATDDFRDATRRFRDDGPILRTPYWSFPFVPS